MKKLLASPGRVLRMPPTKLFTKALRVGSQPSKAPRQVPELHTQVIGVAMSLISTCGEGDGPGQTAWVT
jgi:hypothetical protein